MTIDDTVAISCIATLVGAIVVLWKLNDRRQKASEEWCRVELAKCFTRIQALEDSRVFTMQAHAKEMQSVAENYHADSKQTMKLLTAIVDAIREIARSTTPSPTPDDNHSSGALMAK